MPFCTSCGAEIAENAAFCTSCGHKTGKKKTPETDSKPEERIDTLDAPKTIFRENTASDLEFGPIELSTGMKVQSLTGETIGDRFVFEKELGRGGMGVVYKAHDNVLGTDLALKVLPDELRSDPEGIRDLIEEVKNTRELSHPNIVRMYEFHQFDELRFLAMELIDGPALINVLAERERLTLEEVTEYVHQLASGLSYAHSQKVIHRDIKPHNLMLTSDDVLKICDFGIARLLVDTASRVSQRSTTGTLVYMPPEQYTGGLIGVRSDIYAAAATTYHMLAGHPPFHSGEISYQLLNIDPKPIANVPNRINDVLLKALSKNPDDRYASAAEFGNAFTGRDSIQVAGVPPQAQTGPAQQAAPQQPVQQQPAFQTGPQNTPRPGQPGFQTGKPGMQPIPPGQMRFAGWWARFLAALIDGLLLTVILFLLGLIPFIGWVMMVILPIVYYVSLESGSSQGTPGKRALGLRVTDLNGQRITGGNAFGRLMAKFVSSLILIGWFFPIFTEKKQALHDIMAGTVVIKD